MNYMSHSDMNGSKEILNNRTSTLLEPGIVNFDSLPLFSMHVKIEAIKHMAIKYISRAYYISINLQTITIMSTKHLKIENQFYRI